MSEREDGSDEEWEYDPESESEWGERRDDSQMNSGDSVTDSNEHTEEEWRFDVDEVDEDGVVSRTVDPGEPSLENAVFVVLGAVAMVLVFYQLWSLLV